MIWFGVECHCVGEEILAARLKDDYAAAICWISLRLNRGCAFSFQVLGGQRSSLDISPCILGDLKR